MGLILGGGRLAGELNYPDYQIAAETPSKAHKQARFLVQRHTSAAHRAIAQ